MNIVIRRSLAEVSSLVESVKGAYKVSFVDGYLVHSRENDVYKMFAENRTYLLKVYTVNSMPEANLRFIDSIVSTAYGDNYIVRTKAGKLQHLLSYPEGNRVAVLYEYFESVNKKYECVTFHRFGEEIARFHNVEVEATNPEITSCSKIENLIIEANLNHHEKFKLLEVLSFVESFPKANLNSLDAGLCHGDCHIENVVETKNGTRLIDFDQINVGYFASDFTSIIWANHYGMGVKFKDIEDFLEGYSTKRHLPKLTKNTLLYFVMKKEIFYISSYLKRQSLIGEAFVNSKLVCNRLLKLHEFNSHKISYILKLIGKYI